MAKFQCLLFRTIYCIISLKNLGTISYDSDGFPLGYGKESQAVLIPAFLSAYTGIDVSKVSLTPITSNPKLNWTLQYDGLEKLFDQLVIAKENERLAKLAGDTLNENKILKEMIIQLIKENQQLKTINNLYNNSN